MDSSSSSKDWKKSNYRLHGAALQGIFYRSREGQRQSDRLRGIMDAWERIDVSGYSPTLEEARRLQREARLFIAWVRQIKVLTPQAQKRKPQDWLKKTLGKKNAVLLVSREDGKLIATTHPPSDLL